MNSQKICQSWDMDTSNTEQREKLVHETKYFSWGGQQNPLLKFSLNTHVKASELFSLNIDQGHMEHVVLFKRIWRQKVATLMWFPLFLKARNAEHHDKVKAYW